MAKIKLQPASQAVIDFVEGAKGVVEANSYESMALWQTHTDNGGTWVKTLSCIGVCAGTYGKDRVFISLSSAVVNGKKIIFYEPTSIVVNWALVDKWIESVMPESTYRNKCLIKASAMNFHAVL
jgi:hypothetical protein